MFGFPPILDGNAGIKFTRDADSGFPKPGIREIFYSVRDGDWLNPNVWQTASGRVGLLPSANDDVYVRHIIGFNPTTITTINNLYVINRLNFIAGANVLNVTNVISTGILDMTISGANLGIAGNNNRIANLLTASTNSTINYNGAGDQTVLPLFYQNLWVTNRGVKKVISDLILNNNLFMQYPATTGLAQTTNDLSGVQNGILDLGAYSLTVNGTSIVSTNTYLRKYNSEGNILFVGLLTFAGSGTYWGLPDFNGNINVELRGGLTNSGAASVYGGLWNTGTGTWRFTTNNQNVTHNAGTINYTNKFEIEDGRTVTVLGNAAWTLSDTINGLGATARLTMGASSILNFATAASVPSMTTGIWDFTTNANTIGYTGNYSATIPSYFTNFHSLTISGTGTKTLGVNTTINGNLTVSSGATLDLSSYNIDIIGTSTITGTLNKTGAGSVLFRGLINFVSTTVLDFSGGNPTVELRGGISYLNFVNTNFKSGTSQWSFTTNNQSLTHQSGSTNVTFTFNCPVLISGAITVTHTISGVVQGVLLFNNSFNGNNVNSKFVSNGIVNMANASFPTPMTTGIIDLTTNANTLIYSFNGNYTIPYTSLSGLQLTGTGTKTLSGSTTLLGSLTIGNGATLECSTFNLTINGTTSLGATSLLSKTGVGNVLFVGTIGTGSNSTAIDFSVGNPTVELRGGITTNFILPAAIKTGTGQWTFSTNNQSILGQNSLQFDCPILISGAITLTIGTQSTTVAYNNIFNGVVNGNNASSKLATSLAGTSILTITYNNTTQPMATGILDTSTNLNTFIYGAGNQQVKGNPGVGLFQQYRNLTLNGGGNKTLQGNINVQNTYTVTAPAALVLNGFTKTP
jgi:hypothetical protein